MTKPDRTKTVEKNKRLDIPHFISLAHEFSNSKPFIYMTTKAFILKDIVFYYGTPEANGENFPVKVEPLTVRMAIGDQKRKSMQAFEFEIKPGVNQFPDRMEIDAGKMLMLRCIGECHKDVTISVSFNKAIKL